MFKVNVLVNGSVALKGSGKEKHVSGEALLSKEEAESFAEDLIKFQKSKILTLERVEEEEVVPPPAELTPEEKAEKKDAIKAELAKLKEESKDASDERKVEIKELAKGLKQQAEAL